VTAVPAHVAADTAVAEILARAQGRQLCVVGLGGRGASGKTTLARRVPGAQIVSTDAFWDGSRFDLERLRAEVLEPLARGARASFDTFDWQRQRPGPQPAVVEPQGIVVVEGVCALHRALRDAYDLRVWLDTPREICLARAIARDGEEARREWEERWIPGEERYIAADRPQDAADLLIESSLRGAPP
jgi:uridine kinase